MSELPSAVSITREPDDALVDVRISLGQKNGVGVYIVFRGDPARAAELLDLAAVLGREHIVSGHYTDHCGRPQG